MTDKEQTYIFQKNLLRYLSENNKTQLEVANAIGVSHQTFSTWCRGIALPRMGKIQLLADYFRINKSDLIEERTPTASSPAAPAAPVLTPHETDLILSYREAEPWVQMSVDKLLGIEDEVEKKEKKDVGA